MQNQLDKIWNVLFLSCLQVGRMLDQHQNYLDSVTNKRETRNKLLMPL